MDKREKILIVDDEPGALEMMGDMLRSEGYITVGVGSARAALEFLNRDNFDVVLTDIRMPGMNGLELVQRLQVSSPETVPILITAYCSVESAQEAIHLGVYDYICKPVTKSALCNAICSALARKKLATERSWGKALEKIATVVEGWQRTPLKAPFLVGDASPGERKAEGRPQGQSLTEAVKEGPIEALSRREAEILRYVAEGYSNKRIAYKLKISEMTVKNHMSSIMRKLAASDRTHAVTQALRCGWLTLDGGQKIAG